MTTKLYNTCEYTCTYVPNAENLWWLQNKKNNNF